MSAGPAWTAPATFAPFGAPVGQLAPRVGDAPADLAGNRLSSARNLGTLAPAQNFSDFVGSADKADFYRLNITQWRQVTLNLDGLSADADLQLLNYKGKVIATSSRGGAEADSIVRNLAAGTYYVRVYQYAGDTTYDLTINADPVDSAGNTAANATNLRTLLGTRTSTDFVGNVDPNDYYRFTVTGTSDFSVSLTGLSDSATVELLSESGDVLALAVGSGAEDGVISQQLAAGSYLVHVFQSAGDTEYRMTLSATPVDNAGNSFDTARDIGALSGTVGYTDFVGAVDGSDYYHFTLGADGSVTLRLDGLTSDANLRLFGASGNLIASSTRSRASSELITRALTAGEYYVQVYQGSRGNTYYNLAVTAVDSGGGGGGGGSDWFGTNLRDAGLMTVAQSLGGDGVLSRVDMIAIFRAAGSDDQLVDSTELADLRAIVNNGAALGMADYVRVLSGKIANGSTANARYLNASLGNLVAGSNAAQLDKLLNKWFLGLDHPRTSYTYQLASGSLFQDGAAYTDIVQGYLGDCYLLAGLAAAAQRDPGAIAGMFTDNGDGTFTVRFYNGSTADYVTVDTYLPTFSGGQLCYANYGDMYNNANNELWVALAEKAYVQINESGWIGHGTANSYSAIEGGYTGLAIEHVTGRGTTWAGLDLNAIVSAFTSGRMIAFSSRSSGTSSGVVASHAYTMVGYDAGTQTLTMYNPWGTTISLTWAQVSANYAGWYRTTT